MPVAIKLAVAVVALFIPAAPGGGQVVVLVDHSLSMGQPTGISVVSGASRLEVARAALSRLQRALVEVGIEPSYLAVGRGAVAEAPSLAAALRGGARGASPIYRALQHASGMRRVETIVLASDGLDGEQPGRIGQMPPQIVSRRQHVVLLQFPLPANRPLEEALGRAVTASGGTVVPAAQASAGASALVAAVLDPPASGQQSGPPRDATQALAVLDRRAAATPLAIVDVLLAYAIGMLGVLVVVAARAALVRAEHRNALGSLPPPTAVVDLRISRAADRRGADAITQTLESLPTRIGPGLGGPRRVASFTVERRQESVWMVSRAGHLVNGVLTRGRALKAGDVVAVGGYRVQFGGERLVEPPLPQARPLRPLPEGIVALLLSVAAGVGLISSLLPPSLENRSAAAEWVGAAGLDASASAPTAGDPDSAFGVVVATAAPLLDSALIAPRSVDLLFVHAHPDDETLDFGVLIARAVDAGLSVATVLMTDGEAGLDRFPDRGSPPGYPDRAVRGRELAELRISEATRALAVLGSDRLIRLALPNSPYFRGSQARRVEDVLRDWASGDAVARLVAVITKLAPSVVVGPDGPSSLHEHFEHEATGLLVQLAVEQLRATGVSPNLALLTARDPRQGAPSPAWYRVDGGVRQPASALTYRQLQLLALKQYQTQSDATVFGVERLAEFAAEYYVKTVPGRDESMSSLLSSVAASGEGR